MSENRGFRETKGDDAYYDDDTYEDDMSLYNVNDPEYDPEDELMYMSRMGMFRESNVREREEVNEFDDEDARSNISADDVSVGSIENATLGFNERSGFGMPNDISLIYGDDSFIKCVAKVMIDLNMEKDVIDRAIQNIKYIGPDSFTLSYRNCTVFVFANFKFMGYPDPPSFKRTEYQDIVDDIGVERYLRYMNRSYKKLG
jgi:hypothetical protein